jgi:hypothetical protein
VSAAGQESVALKADGTVWAWGENGAGQLGTGTTTDGLTPVLVGTGAAAAVAGTGFTLVVKSDGSLLGWGLGGEGQLGGSPTVVLPAGLAYAVNPAGYVPGAAITPNSPSSSGGAIDSYSVSPPLPAGLALDAVTGVISGTPTAAVARAAYVVTATNAAGSATATLSLEVQSYAIGGVVTGLQGSGLTLASPGQPNLVVAAGATTFAFASRVASGASFAVTVLQQPGSPAQVCAVTGGTGVVGATDVTGVAVSCRSAWWKVAAGSNHTVGIRPDGTLWAWGDNGIGQLGDGTTTSRSAPVQVGSGFASVAAGPYHTVAVKTDGTLWAWGYNGNGQLGDGTTTQRVAPVQVGSGFASVAAGYYHTVAVKTDGTLWAWGYNGNGQLGDGTTTQRVVPVQVGSGFDSLAAGGAHSMAVKTDGTLWAWGDNSYGQLGAWAVVPAPVP